MIKLEDSLAASEGETSTGQPMLFNSKAEIKRRIYELQQMVDSPTEAEFLLENLQATNAQLVRDLEDARKEIEDSILKREELISHYETLLQDKQVTLEDLEHQLGRAKARVYDLDTDLRAARYKICKAEDALEQQAEQQEFIQSDEPALKVPTQLVKREAKDLSIPWNALRDILEFLPPTSNLEHAYVLDRQVLFTLFRLTYRERWILCASRPSGSKLMSRS